MKLSQFRLHAFVFTLLVVPFISLAQPCPGFQSGNPANHLYTVNFYDVQGNYIKSCECQLTGNAFKCGNCLPSGFLIYQYVYNGVEQDCYNTVVLPVGLLGFNATVSNGDVTLSWTTETERDNAEFILERSSDAVDYVPFGKTPGAGNSLTLQSYSMLDSDPLKGTSYYRLSQRDINGTLTVLAIVSIGLSANGPGLVFAPNPAQGQMLLQLPLHAQGQEFDVSVTNSIGETVRFFRTTEDMQLELPSGIYQVVARSGSQVWSEKLVVLD
jgi:hypothetical protein